LARKILFIFAHQDDEIAYIVTMRNFLLEGNEVHVVWTTDGAHFVPFEVRYAESLKAMKFIGVPEENLHFLKFPDGHSILFPRKIVEKVSSLMSEIEPNEIYTIAYEGGHPDHDFAHVAAVISSKRVFGDSCPPVFEAPLYNSYQSHITRFSRFIPATSPVFETRLQRRDILFKLKVILSYKSQYWIAIFPAIFFAPVRAMAGAEQYREVPSWNYLQPPHEGKLGYERLLVWRLFHIRFSDFKHAVMELL